MTENTPTIALTPRESFWAEYTRKRNEARARSPFGVLAHNGMNLRWSLDNPKSRLSRIVNYIRLNGATEKRTILRNVFNKEVGKVPFYEPNPLHLVSRGWGIYVWTLAVEAKILTKTRIGNRVWYSLGENATRVI